MAEFLDHFFGRFEDKPIRNSVPELPQQIHLIIVIMDQQVLSPLQLSREGRSIHT